MNAISNITIDLSRLLQYNSKIRTINMKSISASFLRDQSEHYANFCCLILTVRPGTISARTSLYLCIVAWPPVKSAVACHKVCFLGCGSVSLKNRGCLDNYSKVGGKGSTSKYRKFKGNYHHLNQCQKRRKCHQMRNEILTIKSYINSKLIDKRQNGDVR
jgi:hypothetical protein